MPHRISTLENRGPSLDLPLAANALIPSGNLVCLDADNNAVLASDAAGLRIAGVAQGEPGGRGDDDADNTGNPAGARQVLARQGIYRFRNSATKPVTPAELGKLAFVEDPGTLAKESAHSVAAGVPLALEPGYVWLWIPDSTLRENWMTNLFDNQPGSGQPG